MKEDIHFPVNQRGMKEDIHLPVNQRAKMKYRHRHKLAKCINGKPTYAEVEISVDVTEGKPSDVFVFDKVFAWLKDVYGPDAWEWPVCGEYRAAAIDGVIFALDNASPTVRAVVCVEHIHVLLVDSSAEAVAYAAAKATWSALGLLPTKSLKIYGSEVP